MVLPRFGLRVWVIVWSWRRTHQVRLPSIRAQITIPTICATIVGIPLKLRTPLLLLSKQISEETLDIPYGENLFEVHLHDDGEADLAGNFTEANRRRMRRMVLIAWRISISYMLDDILWS
jgi:hypothetical protein